jgi:hypothetical protein
LTQLFERRRRYITRPSRENEDFREAARTNFRVRNRKIGNPWSLPDSYILFDGFEVTVDILQTGGVVIGAQPKHIA